MKKLMLIVGAFMLFGLVAKAQPSKVDKPTEWKPNTTVLVSPNKQYRLSYQSDGNLVVYNKSNKAVWDTKTNGKTPNKLVFQANGNLVLFGPNNDVYWTAFCHNIGGKIFQLSDQGILSVWNDKYCIWPNANRTANLIGTIKRWDGGRGLGFITGPDGVDIFLHHTGIMYGIEEIKVGTKVTYNAIHGPKGYQAQNVQPL